MSTYGDGSNGALNVTSGSYSLALDTKHQFTTVNVASGATLTTGSTVGSVLYILATTSITIDGTINLANIVNHGRNTWSVIIDGDTYNSPSTAAGGDGGYFDGVTPAGQSLGFGGGGSGGTLLVSAGGAGGVGSATAGTGGSSTSITAFTDQELYTTGIAGTGSSGGSGSAYALFDRTSGDVTGYTFSGNSGRGGNAYGESGATAGTGTYVHTGGSGSYTYGWYVNGGGGAGGRAGRPGVHIVLKSPSITLNGNILINGTAGSAGGNGGQARSHAGLQNFYGAGGGGGGGGHGGNAYITYSNVLTGAGLITIGGGAGGAGGSGADNLSYVSPSGSTGSTGQLLIQTRTIQLDRNTNAHGTMELEFETATLEIMSGTNANSQFSTLARFQPLTQKDYEIRISNHDGEYLSTLTNISSDFAYQQSINQNASALNISVARSPDNKATTLDILQDHLGETITDSNGDIIYVPTETPNSVGPGTDIDLNHNVDVYAFYGGFEQLLDHLGDPILDTNGDNILTSYGNPNGLRVFSGYIADYELLYGQTTGVNIVVVPHATELSHYVFMDASDTSVEYLNTDPVKMARDAMDNYIAQGGVVTYDDASMPLSGQSSDYTFNLQTTREAVDKSVELLPTGYYQYAHPGEKKVYLLEKGTTADHTFYYQFHIQELKLKKSITQLKNKVYFVGGDTGAGDSLFTFTQDESSQSAYRAGLERLADSRVKLTDSAQALSFKELNSYKEPRYRTTVTISDKMYDIETIRLGQMVGFKNFGTFVDNLILQIVSVSRQKHSVTFDLDMIIPSDTKRLIELKKELNSQIVAYVPDTPTELVEV